MRKYLPALLGALVWLGLPSGALAVEPLQGITASPPRQSLSLAPGSRYTGSVDISNPGNTEYNFIVSAAPFSVQGEDYDQQFNVRPDLVDSSKWFSFPTAKYRLKPGQHTLAQFKVQVPQDIAGGGYYAVVFAQADALPGAGVQSQKRVGMVTYITVGGDVQREGQLAGFTVPPIGTEPPLRSLVRLQNTGNVHFDSTVSLQIKDLFGNMKYQQDASHIIMPKSTRKITLDWTKAPSFGLFRVGGTVKYLDGTEKLPTRWTLMLSANAFLIIMGVLTAIGLFAFLTRRGRGNVRRG